MNKLFSGGYALNVKELIVSAVVSGENLMLISPPGTGKTDMASAAADTVYPNKWIRVDFDPSTPPSVVKGSYDPAQAMQGKLVRITEGTLSDAKIKIAILDEFARTNDATFDACLSVLAPKDIEDWEKPVFIATSNFFPKSERTAALRDRFAMWPHIMVDTLSLVNEIVNIHLLGKDGGNVVDFSTGMPDEHTIIEIRKMIPNNPQLDIVKRIITDLAQEALAQGMNVNNRRIVQWARVIFRASVYYSGTENFSEIPQQVKNTIRTCYPSPDIATFEKWQKVCRVLEDKLVLALEAIKAEAYQKFSRLNNCTPSEKPAILSELGIYLAQAQGDIEKIAGNDIRGIEAKELLAKWFQSAVLGKPFGEVQ